MPRLHSDRLLSIATGKESNTRETIEETEKLTIESIAEHSCSILILVRPFWFGTRRPEDSNPVAPTNFPQLLIALRVVSR